MYGRVVSEHPRLDGLSASRAYLTIRYSRSLSPGIVGACRSVIDDSVFRPRGQLVGFMTPHPQCFVAKQSSSDAKRCSIDCLYGVDDWFGRPAFPKLLGMVIILEWLCSFTFQLGQGLIARRGVIIGGYPTPEPIPVSRKSSCENDSATIERPFHCP